MVSKLGDLMRKGVRDLGGEMPHVISINDVQVRYSCDEIKMAGPSKIQQLCRRIMYSQVEEAEDNK